MDPQIVALQQQLAQQAAQIAAVQAQQTPPALAVVPFALTPALATQNIINMTALKGTKLYNAIMTPLVIMFGGSSERSFGSLKRLSKRLTALVGT
jgi:hypothetical protein